MQVSKSVLTLAILSTITCQPSTSQPVDGTVFIPMRDGVRLATDLYVPEAGEPPYPVILIRTPYNKSWLAGYGQYYSRSGYVVAIQDVRGRWASEGHWEPFLHEGYDGFDTIEWLGTREWSTGKVGMVGGSYSGTIQFAAAVQKPPHLVTIVPNVAPAMPYHNIPREGGALALGWAVRWTDIMENARTGRELQAKLERSIVEDWSEPLAGLPVIELDRTVVGHEVSYFRDWIHHRPGDDYWEPVSYLSALEEVEIPVFLQSGWFDPGTRGARLAFRRLVRGGNPHVRLVLGPWAHGDRGTRYLNGVDMGAAAERDLMAEYRRWFDFWLTTDARDAPNAPGVELYVMGSNHWLSGVRYPLEGTSFRPLYLAGSPGGDAHGRLEWDEPVGLDAFDTFTYDPGEPTPSFHAALKRGTLDEYRARVDTGSDVLVYESEPLDAPLDIVGPIEARLYASSSAKDTDWTATLYGLTSTGDVRVLGLTFGITRARYRDSLATPSLLEPGTVYPFVIDLGHTAVTVQAGERLRLEIASAAFPEFSRNLNTGGHNELETDWVPAHQRVYRDSGRASQLLLPIIERR
ncbi:MAG: CocE/NonD family hydrolase [Gemmatimonadetes bacterium]|nr:CocE/NonD family hydrolase [Gemmatimonadota bacterium]